VSSRRICTLIGLLVLGWSSWGWGQSAGELRACRHAIGGARAPKLESPQAAANHLRRKPNFRIPWIHRYLVSLLTTRFKKVGIVGWTDYCVEACAVGAVVHADRSADGFYTVDLALDSFAVQGQETVLDKPRFVRAEIRGPARKQATLVLRRGGSARICGELKWDHDGFLEIHPRHATQVEALASSRQSAALGPHANRGWLTFEFSDAGVREHGLLWAIEKRQFWTGGHGAADFVSSGQVCDPTGGNWNSDSRVYLLSK